MDEEKQKLFPGDTLLLMLAVQLSLLNPMVGEGAG